GPLDPPGVEDRRQAVGEVRRRRPAADRVAVAEARPVEGDHVRPGREERGELGEHLQVVRVPVEQDERRPVAEPGDADPARAVPRPQLRLQHGKSSLRRSAASTPETAQKLTHWPGWVALPQRYSPRRWGLRWARRPARMNAAVITGFM